MSNMPLEEAKAVLVAVGTATSRHNMVRRAACQGLADSHHSFASICKNQLPKGSVATPAGELDLVQDGAAEEPAEGEAGGADQMATLMSYLSPLWKEKGIPIASLNMSHFGDTEWHGSFSKEGSKVKASIDAVMGYDVAGALSAEGVSCGLKARCIVHMLSVCKRWP